MCISVVMPIYNHPERLRQSLKALQKQTNPDFFLFIINSGGDSQLELVVNEFKNKLNLEYHYLYPSTKKFKAGAARNLAFKKIKTERIICLDSDMVATADLVEKHKSYGNEPVVVAGMRVSIPIHLVDSFIANPEYFKKVNIIDDRVLKNLSHERYRLFKDMQIPGNRTPELCYSCNISYPTKELLTVGGFWEKITGWGREDAELAMRLCFQNCTTLLDTSIIAFHLDHPLTPSARSFISIKKNECLYQYSKLKQSLLYNAKNMISKCNNLSKLLLD